MVDTEKYPEPMTAEEAKARGSRNVILALAIVAFMALVFVVTMVRMSENTKREAAESDIVSVQTTVPADQTGESE